MAKSFGILGKTNFFFCVWVIAMESLLQILLLSMLIIFIFISSLKAKSESMKLS